MPIDTLLKAFLFPLIGVSAWCAIVWMPWSAKQWGGITENDRRAVRLEPARIALTAVGVLAAFAFSARTIAGSWPPIPPTLTTGVNAWFAPLALVSAAFSVVDVFLVKPWWARAIARAFGALLVCGLPVVLLIESGWYTRQPVFDRTSGPLWIVAGVIPALIAWYAFAPTKRDDSRLPTVLPLGVYMGVAAPSMAVWSVAINAQFLGAVALALVPIGVITIWRPGARATDAVLGYCVLMSFASLTAAYHFADEYPPALSAIFVALAPAALLVMRIPTLSKRGHILRAALATAIVLVPAGVGAGLGASAYLAEDERGTSGGNDYFEDMYGE